MGQPWLVQAPFTQACPAPHAVPQAPQFWKLICVSTHWLPQAVVPVGHAHLPAMQLRPLPHLVPHVPQFCESLEVSTQLWPHRVSDGAQPAVHVPALHT